MEPTNFDGLTRSDYATYEPVLSAHGGCPVDGTMVWLESLPDEYGPLEEVEQLHEIVWHAEPGPHSFSTLDD